MKHLFWKSLWQGYKDDLAGAIKELYTIRMLDYLTDDQRGLVEILYNFTLRLDIFDNVYRCARLLVELSQDDDQSLMLNDLMEDSPYVQHWTMTLTTSQCLVDFMQLIRAERRAA